MEKENTTIATEVLRLLKEENEKSENKSRQAIKRIYLLLIIVLALFVVSIVDSIYQRCRIIDLTRQYKIVEKTIDEACELEHHNWGFSMLKLEFNRDELQALKDKLYLSDIQENIMEYRAKNYSRVKMAELEHTSVATIDREIKKIAAKIAKIIW